MRQEKIDKLLQLIRNDKPQREHLFKRLSTTDNPIPLLNPLKDAGYFSPQYNMPRVEDINQKGYYTIPHWNILGYLENIAKFNNKNCNDDVTNILLEIISSIMGYRNKSNERIDNYMTDYVLIKVIFLLPIENITKSHVEYVRTALNSKWNSSLLSSEIKDSVLPPLLRNSAKDLIKQLLNIILDYRKHEKQSPDEYHSLVDKYWLTETLNTHKKSIARLVSIEAAEIALNKIIEITNNDESQFNQVWIPTIEDHSQTTFPDRYECQLVYFVRDMLESINLNDVSKEIEALLEKEHPIFIRLAIHIINFHFDELQELLWSWDGNPLELFPIKHELYELIKNNCNSFDKNHIDIFLKWIEDKNYFISDKIEKDKEQVEKITAYRKKEWLSALFDTKDKDVIKAYNKYDMINPAKLDHPGFDYWMESGWVGSESPVDETELLTKSIDELVVYLSNYKGEEGWRRPSIDGLSDAFRNCVSLKPLKYSSQLKPFLNVERIYQKALLRGFSEAWKAERDFNIKNLLEYIYDILITREFWEETYQFESYNYRNSIISQITNLITDGTINKSHAFEPEFFPKIEEILLLLAKKVESEYAEIHDLVTSVLNSVKGMLFSAMIEFSYRYAQIILIDKEERWISSIKDDFTKRLDKRYDSSREYTVVLGEYLPKLYYLDKDWTISNLDKIFPKNDDFRWKDAFTGYLYYAITVYSHLYKLLAKNNHYEKALNTDFKDEHIITRLVQHICVAYIEELEQLEDETSLIYQLIDNSNIKHLSAIIRFFSMNRDDVSDKIKNRIKPLWAKLFLTLKEHQDEDKYQQLISDTSGFLALTDNIDEDVFEWLKFSTKYIGINFNGYSFVENLLKHVENTPEEVGNLYLEMMENGFYPDYKKENIIELIKELSINNQYDKAFMICTQYLNNGIDFIKPTLKSIKEKRNSNEIS